MAQLTRLDATRVMPAAGMGGAGLAIAKGGVP